jgi:tetratricopeptide (TPR) repeat protein
MEHGMADGFLGGILGEEDDKREIDAPDALAGADSFAVAVAAKLSGNDPGVARKTEEFLSDQSRLLKIQAEHLKDEHAARLRFLQGQAREVDIRRLGVRLRVGFQFFLALLATTIGIGLVVMVHDAVTSRSVMIDPFEVPPSLSADGLNGKVVAAGLLDVLTRIQDANHKSALARNLSNTWTNEISMDVPDTGISIGQLERMIKTRFGHDQHIEGDLVRIPAGLTLTVRGSGILPKTFTGDAGALDKLLTQGGEYVYSQSQPGLWGAYLLNTGRNDEAIRFAQGAYVTADPSERPYLLNAWGNAIAAKGDEGAMAEALSLFREEVRLKPDYWVGYNNIMYALSGVGDEEGVIRVGEEMMKAAGGRPGRAPDNYYTNYDEGVWDLQAAHASGIADMESHGGVGTTGAIAGAENLNVALIEMQLHDIEAGSLRLKTTAVDEKNLPDTAQAAMDRALMAEESADLKTAANEWDGYAAAYANPIISTSNPPYICFAAVTYEKTRQPAKADAALKSFGNHNFVDCERFKGDVLDLRGDWSGAQEWYANAVKLAPSVPSGYYSWGVALVKHGDLDGAAAKFKDANRKGPHWAEPLKAWGDVLVKQGNNKDALAKYDEALKYAPNWAALKEARVAATNQKS